MWVKFICELFSHLKCERIYTEKIYSSIFWEKKTASTSTRTCVYQGGGNISFSESFAYILNESSLWIVAWNGSIGLNFTWRQVALKKIENL